jgi:wyosine [tRNA(Phe)-imidazoG37] synthetase (radical SAM superfamily)
MKKTEPRYKSLHLRAGFTCNNACVFCCDPVPADSVRLAPAVARQMLEDNVALGTVVFTSHEPTLNSDLVTWVGWASELGYEKVSLVTNGRRLAKRDLAARLVAAGLDTVDISIHGHTAPLHERITRRRGSFAEAVAGIEAMRAERERHPLSLKLLSTVTGMNVAHLPDMADFMFGFEPESYGLNAVFLSGAALENADEVAVSYEAIIDSFARCLQPHHHRDISLSEIPPCRTHGRLPPEYIGVREDFHGVQIDAQGRIQGSRLALAPPGRGFAYRDACQRCAYRPVCDGVPEAYQERFGWAGFEPVDADALALLASTAQPLEPPPFEREDALRELLTPPAGEWEVVALKVGPTDALAELEVGLPHDLKVTLVISPRDDAANAYRRTRRFNVAIRGQSASKMECELANVAIRWMARREHRIRR